MSGHSYIVADIETSGPSRDRHEIIQIGAIAARGHEVIEELEVKLRFDLAKADPKALQVNSYDPDIWRRESDGVLKRGTIYVTLNRMMEKGYVETAVSKDPYASGKPRPMYTVTGHGSRTFRAQQERRTGLGLLPDPASA